MVSGEIRGTTIDGAGRDSGSVCVLEEGERMPGSAFVIDLDVTALIQAAQQAAKTYTTAQGEKILHDTLIDTAKKTKTIVKRTASADFQISAGKAAAGVLAYTQHGPFNIVIPLRGSRYSIGGTFPMKVGAKRRVTAATIHRGKSAGLPLVQKNQGGNAIFKAMGIAMTRSPSRHLVSVVGRSLPQMITDNDRTKPKVENQLDQYIAQRLAHHIGRLK